MLLFLACLNIGSYLLTYLLTSYSRIRSIERDLSKSKLVYCFASSIVCFEGAFTFKTLELMVLFTVFVNGRCWLFIGISLPNVCCLWLKKRFRSRDLTKANVTPISPNNFVYELFLQLSNMVTKWKEIANKTSPIQSFLLCCRVFVSVSFFFWLFHTS